MANSNNYNLTVIHSFDKVRRLTGVGFADINTGMALWPTKNPWLAALYMVARSHAVVVKSDRDERDRTWAVREYIIQKEADSK